MECLATLSDVMVQSIYSVVDQINVKLVSWRERESFGYHEFQRELLSDKCV